MNKSFINGGLLAGLTFLTVILANLPGRLALGIHESQFGMEAGTFVFVGLMADVHGFAPIMGGLVLFTWLVFALLGKVFASHLASARFRIIIFGLLHFVIFLGTWIFSVAVSEFRLQRGPYPSFVDLHTGVDVGFISSTLTIFFMDRYFWSALICLLMLIISFLIYAKYSDHNPFRFTFSEAGAYVFTLTFFIFVCFQLFIISPKLFAGIEDRSRLKSSLYFLELPTKNIIERFYDGPNYREVFKELP